IRSRVLNYDYIVGIHDLIVHDYGPGRVMVSLHAEVNENCDIVAVHEVIDRVEREVGEELGCHIVIHMDPIAVDDIELEKVKGELCRIVGAWGKGFSIHDFRVVRGKDRTNFIFDVVVPFESELSEEAVCEKLEMAVHGMDVRYYAVINVDRPFH
ncbi:MAG: cation-efflux pump, partial [Oscillospiraceae bacterium]|nr:cation-efflux pump [Oscillospiraceae bacterium]